MTDRYTRYKQTEKGKIARQKAQENYLKTVESWQVSLKKDYSDEIESYMPEGMSRAGLLKKLLGNFVEEHRHSSEQK